MQISVGQSRAHSVAFAKEVLIFIYEAAEAYNSRLASAKNSSRSYDSLLVRVDGECEVY